MTAADARFEGLMGKVGLYRRRMAHPRCGQLEWSLGEAICVRASTGGRTSSRVLPAPVHLQGTSEVGIAELRLTARRTGE